MKAALASVLAALFFATMPAGAEPVDFALPDVSGREHRLSEHRGKWVVVNFWATWCAPCLEEIPELVEFHERRRHDDAVVIGVNFEEIETGPLEAFISAQRITYPVVRAGSAPIVPFEPLKGLPSTFFVDPEGELVATHVGPVTRAAIEDFIAREAER